MGRPSNTRERQADILDALLQVMSERGYRGASVAAIARQAGLNPGLLHYHFARKLDILVALVERLTARAEARAERRLARAGDDPCARLVAYATAYVALGRASDPRAVAAWVAVGAEAVREPEIRRVVGQAVTARLAAFEGLFQACLTDRGRSTRPAPRLAAAVVAAIEGAYQLSVTAPGALPTGFAAPMLERTIRGLLGE